MNRYIIMLGFSVSFHLFVLFSDPKLGHFFIMRFDRFLSFAISAVLGSPLLNGTSDIWERSPVRLGDEESDIFSTDGAEDGLNLAFIGTEGSVPAISGGDIADTSGSSLISSLLPDIDGKLDLDSHADLDLGDMNGSPVSENQAGLEHDYQDYFQEPTQQDDIALEYSLDPIDETVLAEEQSSCGSSATPLAGKMRRNGDFCTNSGSAQVEEQVEEQTDTKTEDEKKKICPDALSPYCCDGNRYLYGLPTVAGYRVADCAPCEFPCHFAGSRS